MNQVLVFVRVRGILKQEGDVWVAGFPRLDVYSQGDTADDAKENASEALRLWVDSCLDRGTLGEALRELGWHRFAEGITPARSEEDERVEVGRLEDVLGEPWEQQIEIPAYQAAEFLAASAGA
jgi:predicted RNase H-like HicB family nuclease